MAWRWCYGLASGHAGSIRAACCCHHDCPCEQQDLQEQPCSLSMHSYGVLKRVSVRDGCTCSVMWLLGAILLIPSLLQELGEQKRLTWPLCVVVLEGKTWVAWRGETLIVPV